MLRLLKRLAATNPFVRLEPVLSQAKDRFLAHLASEILLSGLRFEQPV
jgi:hypothetical protein